MLRHSLDLKKLLTQSNSGALGIDIGGANLKLALGGSRALNLPFAMWKEHDQLSDRLQHAVRELGVPPGNPCAITMTGELADCFATRREGVGHILNHVSQVFEESTIFVYSVDGHWLSCSAAQAAPWDVAASNWHALASWVASQATDWASRLRLVVDIGSTTVDIIPVRSGRVATTARTDRDRLQLGQLVYTGVERSPVAAFCKGVSIDGVHVPLMAERFADSLDCYLATGLIPAESHNRETADGRPRTAEFARARIARMVGEDVETLGIDKVEDIAHQMIDAQAMSISQAILRNLPELDSLPPQSLLFSGHGHALTERVCSQLDPMNRQDNVSGPLELHRLVGSELSRCAPALAVSQLLDKYLQTVGSRVEA